MGDLVVGEEPSSLVEGEEEGDVVEQVDQYVILVLLDEEQVGREEEGVA